MARQISRREMLKGTGLALLLGSLTYTAAGPLGLGKAIVDGVAPRTSDRKIGLDFGAYDYNVTVTGKSVATSTAVTLEETVENWIFNGEWWFATRGGNRSDWPYVILDWYNLLGANMLSYTPFLQKRKYIAASEENEYDIIVGKLNADIAAALNMDLFELEELLIRHIYAPITYQLNGGTLILKVKSDPSYYGHEFSRQSNPATRDTDPVVLAIRQLFNVMMAIDRMNYQNVIIELEANLNLNLHNQRLQELLRLKADFPYPDSKFKIAVSIEPNLGFVESYSSSSGMEGTYSYVTGRIWDPERTEDYYKGADIVILNDYVSSKEELGNSINIFKQVFEKDKEKLYVRLIVGEDRLARIPIVNAGTQQDIRDMLDTALYANGGADGVLVDDRNGTFIFSGSNNPLVPVGNIYQHEITRAYRAVTGITRRNVESTGSLR